MKVDTEKGEYLWHDEVYSAERHKDEGFDHISMRCLFAVAQRHMDAKEVTPVNMLIGGPEPFDEQYAGERRTGIKRHNQVVFRPGKSEQTFVEWFFGKPLNKKPADI